MSDGTEKRWFSFFLAALTPLVPYANTLGRTALVMLYAAAEHLMSELRAAAKLTDDEIAQAKSMAAEAKTWIDEAKKSPS